MSNPTPGPNGPRPSPQMPPPVPPSVLPYRPPAAIIGDATCPQCSGPANKVKFTWWGGMLGPRLFSHVKCAGCGFTFNSKTGKSNNTAIAIYVGVSFAIIGLILVLRVVATLGH